MCTVYTCYVLHSVCKVYSRYWQFCLILCSLSSCGNSCIWIDFLFNHCSALGPWGAKLIKMRRVVNIASCEYLLCLYPAHPRMASWLQPARHDFLQRGGRNRWCASLIRPTAFTRLTISLLNYLLPRYCNRVLPTGCPWVSVISSTRANFLPPWW